MSHLYGNGVIDPTAEMGREGRKAEDYVVTGVDINERLAKLDSNDATTIGEMRQVVIDAFQEAANKMRSRLEPIQGLLEALKH